MFDFARKEPKKPFPTPTTARVVKIDPNAAFKWSDIRRGVWEAICASARTTTTSRPPPSAVFAWIRTTR